MIMTVLLRNRLKELIQFNLYLVSVRKPIDTSIPMGEMVSTMIVTISKMGLFNLSHRIKSRISHAKWKNGGTWGRKSNLNTQVEMQIRQKRKDVWGIRGLSKEFKIGKTTVGKVITA